MARPISSSWIVDPKVEALLVLVLPHGSDRLPELLLAILGHRVHAMRRAGLVVFFRHSTVLSLMSPPQRRPRCPFKAEAEKRGCHKRSEGPPKGAELQERSDEASGFDRTARLGRTGHKERTPWEATRVHERRSEQRDPFSGPACSMRQSDSEWMLGSGVV